MRSTSNYEEKRILSLEKEVKNETLYDNIHEWHNAKKDALLKTGIFNSDKHDKPGLKIKIDLHLEHMNITHLIDNSTPINSIKLYNIDVLGCKKDKNIFSVYAYPKKKKTGCTSKPNQYLSERELLVILQ